MIGALFAVISIILGAVGYRLDVLYAVRSTVGPMTACLDGNGRVYPGASSIFTGMNFIVTIHKLRPPGMTWFRMPLFLWAIYATSIIQVLATPVLGITLLLLIMERTLHVGIFDPLRRRSGAVPALLLVLFAPGGIHHGAAGDGRHVGSDLDLRPEHIFGYRFIALIPSGSRYRLSGLGPPHVPERAIVHAGDDLLVPDHDGGDPSAIKVWNWLATMYTGSS